MHKLVGLALAAGVLVCSGGGLLADDDTANTKAKAKRGNPEAVFRRIDTNGDGKLSKDEFKAFIEKAMKGKGKENGKGDLIDKLFGRLDTNDDGYLSLEEFKQLRDLREKLAEKKKAKKGNDGNIKSE